jgi:hypothetical protein
VKDPVNLTVLKQLMLGMTCFVMRVNLDMSVMRDMILEMSVNGLVDVFENLFVMRLFVSLLVLTVNGVVKLFVRKKMNVNVLL